MLVGVPIPFSISYAHRAIYLYWPCDGSDGGDGGDSDVADLCASAFDQSCMLAGYWWVEGQEAYLKVTLTNK